MMMPANYSVIAENEMSYVNGGANFIDVDVTYWYAIEVVCGFANGSFSFSIF